MLFIDTDDAVRDAYQMRWKNVISIKVSKELSFEITSVIMEYVLEDNPLGHHY